jgi:hypothetical protein
MTDETDSGQPEGEALPVSTKAGIGARLGDAMNLVTADAEHVIAAIERWYAAHFHAAALAGVAPLSADDKAALIQHVADAVAPAATKE